MATTRPTTTERDQKLYSNEKPGHITFFRRMTEGQGPAPLFKAVFNDHKHTARDVVVKEFKMNSTVYPELFITPYVRHPNILSGRLLTKDQTTYLVMPHFGIGTLNNVESSLVRESNAPIRKYILQQLLSAIIYLAENNIRHQDLHPGNILIDEKAHIKLIDFGRADHINPKKPIFDRFIDPDNHELNTNKDDSYKFCETVLDRWRRLLPNDRFLAVISCSIKTMRLPRLKRLYVELKNSPQPTDREIDAFTASLGSAQALRARL